MNMASEVSYNEVLIKHCKSVGIKVIYYLWKLPTLTFHEYGLNGFKQGVQIKDCNSVGIKIMYYLWIKTTLMFYEYGPNGFKQGGSNYTL